MNTKSVWLIVGVVALVVIVGAGFLFFKKPSTNGNNPPVITDSNIEIFTPKPNELISSPLKITGLVKGNGWGGFEGQVGTVKLFDSSGKELGMAILTASTDWMKLPTNFETVIYFDYPGDGTGKLVFYNENASGEPSRNKTVTVPVKLQKSSSEKTVVKVYFNNSVDVNSCDKVFYTQRTLPKTEGVARVALEQLIAGPTMLEKTAGFLTGINPSTKVQSLTIENGVAKVDFNNELQKGVAGSCKVTAIRAQITQTLKQFPTVKSVVISIDGKTDDVLQP